MWSTVELGGTWILKTIRYFIKYHGITNYTIFGQHNEYLHTSRLSIVPNRLKWLVYITNSTKSKIQVHNVRKERKFTMNTQHNNCRVLTHCEHRMVTYSQCVCRYFTVCQYSTVRQFASIIFFARYQYQYKYNISILYRPALAHCPKSCL